MSKRELVGLLAALGCAVVIAGCASGNGSATSAQISAPVATAIPRHPLATPTVSLNSRQPSPTASQESQDSGVVITGQVKDVEPNAHIIHLDGQVHGFTTVTLGSDVQIVSVDGSPRTLADIKPGNLIQSAGQAVGSGAVLATKIRILPAPAPSAAG